VFRKFGHSDLEFVSDFDIRISDLIRGFKTEDPIFNPNAMEGGEGEPDQELQAHSLYLESKSPFSDRILLCVSFSYHRLDWSNDHHLPRGY